MDIIILCAGFGSRLGSLGRDNPKALLDVAGRPLIEWILLQLVELDFVDTIYVAHNDLFSDRFSDWHSGYSCRKKVILLNNGVAELAGRKGAIADISEAIEGESLYGPLVIFPGDTVFTFNVKKFFYGVKKNPEAGWLSLRVEKDEKKRRKCGVVSLSNDGNISSFVEKPDESKEDYVYKGPCYFPPTVTSKLKKYCATLRRQNLVPDDIGAFISWALRRIPVKGCVMHSGECIDVGSFRDYRTASQRVKRSLEGGYGEGTLF